MKGVVLAGGTGSRLHPLTQVTNKHLMPVHDRPMIYFPLQTLAGMGIREVMVILGGRSIGDIVELLADGHDFGLDLTYRYQRGSLGIAHAIGLTRDFIGDDAFCVVLGDNILRGDPLAAVAAEFEAGPWGGGTLLYRVADAGRFGVAEFDAQGNVIGFEEKPTVPKSDSIPIGVYFLRPDAFEVIERLTPSGRGEFEITDVLNHYVAQRHPLRAPLRGSLVGRGDHRGPAGGQRHGGARRKPSGPDLGTPSRRGRARTIRRRSTRSSSRAPAGRLGRALLAAAPAGTHGLVPADARPGRPPVHRGAGAARTAVAGHPRGGHDGRGRGGPRAGPGDAPERHAVERPGACLPGAWTLAWS